MDIVDAATLADAVSSPAALEALTPGPGGGALVVDLRHVPMSATDQVRRALVALAAYPVVVVGVAPGAAGDPATGPAANPAAGSAGGVAGEADVVVGGADEAGEVVAAVEAHPLAATALVVHLRASEPLGVEEALVAESAVYSMLQAGPEHGRWLDGRATAPARTPDDGERVRAERDGRRLTVTLARPAARNAVDAAMQQALVDALLVAADDGVEEVVLRGDGPVFSAGGDLREFGSLADPASAHLLRLARSPARALHRVAGRTTVHVHGACHGAGVELPAFAHRVVAHPGATFTLPEVAMGLVPGAGGTVSIPRRVGRQRTASLALAGRPIDAPTALAWGLVDAVRDLGPQPGT